MGSSRRWPLRLGLAVVASVLLVTDGTLAVASRPPTSSTTSTTTGGPSTSSTTTTTTTTKAAHGTVVLGPTTGLNEHGCAVTEVPRPDSPPTSSGSTPSIPVATALGHCRILEIGDSLGNDLGWALNREIGSTPGLRLVQMDKSSTGLSASWYYDWPTQLRTLLAEYHPNVVLVFLGGNDQQGLLVNGHAQPFATRGWRSAYLARVTSVMSMASQAGAYVVWVGLPVMQPYGYNLGAQTLNYLYAQAARASANTIFLPTTSLLSDAQGNYLASAKVNGVESVLRSPDGIHFSVAGENVLASYVAREMAELLHVRLPLRAPAALTP